MVAPSWPRQLVNPTAWPSIARAKAAQQRQAVLSVRASIDQLVVRQAVARKVERLAALQLEHQTSLDPASFNSGAASSTDPPGRVSPGTRRNGNFTPELPPSTVGDSAWFDKGVVKGKELAALFSIGSREAQHKALAGIWKLRD